MEAGRSTTFKIDKTPPSVSLLFPAPGDALQDGVALTVRVSDTLSGPLGGYFTIREANGAEGTPIGYENRSATFNSATGNWDLRLNTTDLPDGYYLVGVEGSDAAGNGAWAQANGTRWIPLSIRNWAVLRLLPATPNSQASRTMPVKFSLRVAQAVDPNQPFVHNGELTIKIYQNNGSGVPTTLLQTTVIDPTSRDYRIDEQGQLYITNFQTPKTPGQFTVQVWRKEMQIGSFTFATRK